MERIRKILNEMGHRLNDYQWQNLQLRIREIVGPGEDEICVALVDANRNRSLSQCFSLVINAGARELFQGDNCVIRTLRTGESSIAAIRSLIPEPEPEPTPEEDWEAVDKYIRYCSGHESVCPSRESVRESMDRLRKHVEQK